MTGGGKRCWQQHVIWRWNPASTLRLNSKPLLCDFPHLISTKRPEQQYRKQVHQLTQRLARPYVMAAIERRRSYPSNLTFPSQMNIGHCYWEDWWPYRLFPFQTHYQTPGTELGIGFRVSMGVSVLEDKNSFDRLI